jgi:hypothetical protein
VDKKKDAAFGLSERQREAGCRPELWRDGKPGMAYWDAPTLAPAYAVMPMRFYHWGKGTAMAADYFARYPATGRPVDDITGEALDNDPADPASYALPGPGGRLAGKSPAAAAANVVRGPWKDRKPQPAAAEKLLRDWLAARLASGTESFTIKDIYDAGLADAPGKRHTSRTGRSRSWAYGMVDMLEQEGAITFWTDQPAKRWKICPPPVSEQAPEQEEDG